MIVVGGGPAGIAAASAAADSGQSVLLIDRRPRLGGNVWHATVGERPPPEASTALQQLDRPNVQVACETEVLDLPRPATLLVGFRGTARELRYGALVLATGARERFLPFPGWTLPNVTGVGALQLLAKAGLPVRGRSIVIAGSGPLLFAAAAYLREAGGDVRLIAEQCSRMRLWRFAAGLARDGRRLRQAWDLRRQVSRIPFRTGCWPVRAEGTEKLERVVLRKDGREWTEKCELLACGFHLTPNTELAELLGCRLADGLVAVDEYQRTSVPHVYCAGEPVGIGGLQLAQVEGTIAGLACAGRLDQARGLIRERGRLAGFRIALARTFDLAPQLREVATQDTIVCRCEDVSAGRLASFDSGREARLQTRCGMGRCQGRICGPAAEFLWGWNPRGVRPPVVPATVGQLALASGLQGAG